MYTCYSPVPVASYHNKDSRVSDIIWRIHEFLLLSVLIVHNRHPEQMGKWPIRKSSPDWNKDWTRVTIDQALDILIVFENNVPTSIAYIFFDCGERTGRRLIANGRSQHEFEVLASKTYQLEPFLSHGELILGDRQLLGYGDILDTRLW